MSTEPNAFRGTALPFDTAWAPTVPPGHSQYTWIGHVHSTTPSYSFLLGCVRDESAPKAEAVQKVEQPKKQQQPQQQQPKKAAPQADVPEGTAATIQHVGALSFVVGEIVACEKHANADSLYVEKIDLGPVLGQRQIVSGLVKYLTVEQMVGSKVIVVTNFKKSALRGVESQGMVLCASDADKTNVVLCTPPASAKAGDRIVPVDASIEFPDAVAEVDPKKANNYWSAIAPQLQTNAKGEVSFGDVLLGNASGAATATLTGCKVA